ncbi:MAG TPA: FAD-dependent oxidoreductase, partial [Thioalkalivibrio sp.]|nr:FAD-dependent oxidoreductase [Thioalkalivibrio sp.]
MSDDLIVIGGGIHGVATAFEATRRGWRVRLIEQYPRLAQGTSSRSSKLIHGGLRYLEQGQWRLVRESLQARRRLLRLAPELVELTDFHIPVFADSRRGALTIRAGLSLYALLGGLHADNRFCRLPRRAWSRLDGLHTAGLEAVFRYRDGRTDDAALTRALMHAACDRGAQLQLGETVRQVHLHRDGVEVETDRAGYRAAAVVNATGPWIDQLLARVEPAQPLPAIERVAGTHIVVPGRLRRGIYYVEAPRDARAVFVMPWRGQVMIGTTERVHCGDPAAVAPTDQEIDYLRETGAHYFDTRHVDTQQIIDAFAGLRVLPRADDSPFGRPRDTRLLSDRATRPRLVSILGGKLTAHQVTAE